MRRLLVVSIFVALIFGTIGCDEKTRETKIVFAEIKDINNNKDNTLLWLKVESQYTIGFPLKMVYLAYNSRVKTLSPLATIHFNQTANVYQVYIEMPTLQDLQSWKEAFDKNEPVVLYPKPPTG